MSIYSSPKQSLYTLATERRKKLYLRCPAKSCLYRTILFPSTYILFLQNQQALSHHPCSRWLIQAQALQGCRQVSIPTRLLPSYTSWQPSTPKLSTLSSVRSLPAANSSLSSNFEHFLHFPVLIETCGLPFTVFSRIFHCAKAWRPPPQLASSVSVITSFLPMLPPFKSCH